MRSSLKMAAALPVIVGAVLGTAIAISLVGASGGDGGDRYNVSVLFNASVTQDDIDDTGALLRAYDDGLEFLVMESFPPVGRASMEAEAADFCQTVAAELEAKSYVQGVSCEPWAGNRGGAPDGTISTDNDAN